LIQQQQGEYDLLANKESRKSDRLNCARPGCPHTFKKPASGRRRFCTDKCRKRAVREENGQSPHFSKICPESPKSANDFSKLQTTPNAVFPLADGGDWRWEDHASDRWLDEHYLFLGGRHVATIIGKPGDYRVVYPDTIPVRTATTLEAARKAALNVALRGPACPQGDRGAA
jgi:hypothetical protein